MIAIFQHSETFIPISIPHCVKTNTTFLITTPFDSQSFFLIGLLFFQAFLCNNKNFARSVINDVSIHLPNDVLPVVFYSMDARLLSRIDHIDHHEYTDNIVQFHELHNVRLFRHMDRKIAKLLEKDIAVVLEQIWTDWKIELCYQENFVLLMTSILIEHDQSDIDLHKYIFHVNKIDRYYLIEYSIDRVNRNICHRIDMHWKENI